MVMRVQGRPEDSPQDSLRLLSEENSKMIRWEYIDVMFRNKYS